MALLATAAMFAAAFLAMHTVRLFPVFSSPPDPVAAPVIIHFEPPPPPNPVARPQPTVAAPTPRVAAPVIPPVGIPTGIAPATTAPITAVSPDSASGAPSRRITDLSPTSGLTPPKPIENPRGAVMAPAGVTAPFRPLSPAEKDSIEAVRAARLAEAMRKPMTKEEKEGVRDNMEPGRAPRNTRAGSDGKVVPLLNGGYAVAVPILSISVGGKSAEERKREAAIDSVNRTILARLQDRAHLRRDSLRADSLRRDSLAKRIRP